MRECFNAGKLLSDSGHLQEEARFANRQGFSAFNTRQWLRFLLQVRSRPINIVRPATGEVISNRIFGCRFCSTEVNQALARRATQRFRYSIHDRISNADAVPSLGWPYAAQPS